MASEIDAVVQGLKQDATRALGGKPRRRRAPAVPEAEQIRRFLAGEERARLERGEVSPAEWRRYQETMVEKLRGMGALEQTPQRT